jgi:hypothetical protein
MVTWTQDESVAFECARETITDLMSVFSRQINELQDAASTDKKTLSVLTEQLLKLAAERRNLHVSDHGEISRICHEYGSLVRQHRARQRGIYYLDSHYDPNLYSAT